MTVKQAVRGIAVSVAFMAALGACAGGAGSGGEQTGRPNGDSLEGHEEAVGVSLTAEQVRVALPPPAGLPEGWSTGGAPTVQDGTEAAERCGFATGTGCAGAVAYGLKSLEGEERVASTGDGAPLYINVYSFDSAENAKVAFKGLTAQERREDGSDTRPLKIATGTEETDAYFEDRAYGFSADVMIRLGGVVVHIWAMELAEADLVAPVAKLQIDRIKKMAEGKNPDA
ncbi:hypothetical protein [Streptomyces sp. NPDC000410]|uniref:hypothetical protein n=1 Tax=Streptomyces sp. NPDC000410 TaxID=3154254 RepID=UPI003325AE7F